MVNTFFKLPKIKPRKTVIVGVTASMLAGGVLLSQLVSNHVLQTKQAEKQQQVVTPKIQTVTALGRLQPQGEVIKIAASSSGQGGQGNKIDKLLVKEGEEVKTGQVIAVLDNSDKLNAAYEKASEAVAIARALVNQPHIVLADEPTAALDKKTGRDVVNIMQKLAKEQGCTILMVTHDNRILDIADRIVYMEDGKLSKQPETADISS